MSATPAAARRWGSSSRRRWHVASRWCRASAWCRRPGYRTWIPTSISASYPDLVA